MTNEEFKVEITKNILQGHTCDSCSNKPCKYKTGKRYGTCRQWSTFELKMSSYTFAAKPHKLNLSWSSLADLSENSGVDVKEIHQDSNGNIVFTAKVDDTIKKLIEDNKPIGVSCSYYGDSDGN